MAICGGGPANLKGIIYFGLIFAMIIYSPNPTFMQSLSEIGDLSCITFCMVLLGFLMESLLSLESGIYER